MPSENENKPFWRKIYGFRSATPWKMAVAGLFYWSMVVGVFVAALLTVLSGDDASGKQRPAAAPAIDASTPIGGEDFVLKGVRLGEPVSAAAKRLGEPKAKAQKPDGLTYDYGDIQVTVNDRGDIVNIVTDRKTVATRRGVHSGSSLEEIRKAYGDGYRKTALDGLDLYEYEFAAAKDNPYVLRFAVVRATGTVEYIGCRIPAELGAKALAPVKLNGKWGFIDRGGRMAIAPQFDEAKEFADGLAPVCVADKWGYVDTAGKAVIAPQFGGAGVFSGGYATVSMKDGLFYKWGMIDKAGQMVLPARYNMVGKYSHGVVCIVENKNARYIDPTGKTVIDLGERRSLYFSEGLAAVAVNGRWGYMDRAGKMVIQPQFSGSRTFFGLGAAAEFTQGLARVRPDGKKIGFIDTAGRMVIPAQYDAAGHFAEDLAPVTATGENGKRGYIDKKGNMVIPPQFDLAGSFSHGLAAVKVNGRWGYIDKTGKLAIAPQFDEAGNFPED